MDELERIKATKMQEMMERASRSKDSSHERAPVELSDSDFDQTIRSKPLVVVDCWAAWCYPCRIIAPIVEELAAEYTSVAMFAKLNVDENPSTAMRYVIQSIPTILIIKNGVEVERIVGAVPKAQIEAALKKHL
jgi:thioredoxin 1